MKSMLILDSNSISTLSVRIKLITPSVHTVKLLENAVFLQSLAFHAPNQDGIIQDRVRVDMYSKVISQKITDNFPCGRTAVTPCLPTPSNNPQCVNTTDGQYALLHSHPWQVGLMFNRKK